MSRVCKKVKRGGKLIFMQPQTSKPKESDIQRQIKDYLQLKGWFCVKIHQSLGSYKGIADLYAIKDGRHIWVEVKTPMGKVSPYQEQFRRDVEAHGGKYVVARGIEDLERVMKNV